ncbi:MAG: prepilin-type N-terminal cleavage/methylation domain-containing protein [Methylotenera sp.]|nr:prepilin-type N-terminal cleavage/methylation domain-containing protein [Methylotenera sp.]
MKKQTGFTLIELAIVLVIIGLLLGGVLKGQELINSARVKSLATEFKNIQVYVYGYQDRFRAIPGDDRAADAHVAGTNATPVAPDTNGNGVIASAWNSATQTDDSYLFWQHVRLAGFAPGPTAADDPNYAPQNSAGGRIGIQSVASFAIAGMTGTFTVCSAAIQGRFAEQLDITLDDGDTDAGSVRAFVDGGNAWDGDIQPAEENANYTVCLAF